MLHRNINSNTITRFIGLGNYQDTGKKQKWLYGFVLSPVKFESAITNYTVTESPYGDPSQYTANMLPAAKQYFYNTSTNSNYNKHSSKKRCFNQTVKQC